MDDQSTRLPSVRMMGQFSAEAHYMTMLDALQWSYCKRGAVGKNRIGLVEVMKHKDGKQPLIAIQAKGKSPGRYTKAGLITEQKINCHTKDIGGLYNWHLCWGNKKLIPEKQGIVRTLDAGNR